MSRCAGVRGNDEQSDEALPHRIRVSRPWTRCGEAAAHEAPRPLRPAPAATAVKPPHHLPPRWWERERAKETVPAWEPESVQESAPVPVLVPEWEPVRVPEWERVSAQESAQESVPEWVQEWERVLAQEGSVCCLALGHNGSDLCCPAPATCA